MTIHLIAAGKMANSNHWPEVWKHCYNVLKSLPYTIRIWGDQEIDAELKEDDIDFYNTYLSKLDPIYKYDYVRYIILGKYGGTYMDLDVEIKINFFSLLDPSKVYISEGENNCLVSNHIMSSPPDHFFWYNIRQEIKYRLISRFKKSLNSEYWTIETVGPVALSYILSQNQYKYTPLSKHHFGSKSTELQFCIHHSTKEWTRDKLPPFPITNNL